MTKIPTLLKIPHDRQKSGKSVFFGQIFVETNIDTISFAKEIANAIIIQAEERQITLDYVPQPGIFVSRIEDNNHIFDFQGDMAGYLRLASQDAASFHLSFRETTDEEKMDISKTELKLRPTYTFTLSAVSDIDGELGNSGFWGQLGSNLFRGIETEGLDGRAADENVKIAIVYGKIGGDIKILQ